MAQRIKKAHVGRSIDFKSSRMGDAPLNGVIESVNHGVALIRYYVVRDLEGNQQAFNAQGFVAYIDTRDERIAMIY